jgi:hypothetical protein
MTPTREQILAASAGWVAVLLNRFPGVGNGYLYQRQSKPRQRAEERAFYFSGPTGCADAVCG